MRWRVGARHVVALALLVAATGPAISFAGQQRTVGDGVYTPEQADRGRKVYGVFCENCHAADLGGTNSGDSGAPPLKREGFMAGSDANALFTKMRETMPFDAPGSLEPEEYLDVLAYVFRENGFPPGRVPLVADAAQLRNIRIVRVLAPQ